MIATSLKWLLLWKVVFITHTIAFQLNPSHITWSSSSHNSFATSRNYGRAKPVPSNMKSLHWHFPPKSNLALCSTMLSTNEPTSTETVDDTNESDSNQIGAWVPIGSKDSLFGLGPMEITVMGQRLVVWHDTPPDVQAQFLKQKNKKKKKLKMKKTKENVGRVKWSVMADICPHRLAPLSQGRVNPETNCIECPYHGWQFDSDGTLTDIPQSGLSVESYPKNGNAKTLPVHVAGDLIFAFLPSSIHGQIYPKSLLPEQQYRWLPELMARNGAYFTRDLPYSADFLIENFMDPSHIPFAHHGAHADVSLKYVF